MKESSARGEMVVLVCFQIDLIGSENFGLEILIDLWTKISQKLCNALKNESSKT